MSRIFKPRNLIHIGLMSATILGYSVAANAQVTHKMPSASMTISTAMLSPTKTVMPITVQRQTRINPVPTVARELISTQSSLATDWVLSQTTLTSLTSIAQPLAITPLPANLTPLPLSGDYMKTDLSDLTVPLLGPVNLSVMQDVTPLRFTNITRNRGSYAQSPDFAQDYNLGRYTQSTSATAQVKFKF